MTPFLELLKILERFSSAQMLSKADLMDIGSVIDRYNSEGWVEVKAFKLIKLIAQVCKYERIIYKDNVKTWKQWLIYFVGKRVGKKI